MSQEPEINLDTSIIKEWRSIVTLIVFVITNIIVLFPFHIPVYLPRVFTEAIRKSLVGLRIISRPPPPSSSDPEDDDNDNGKTKPWVRFRFPMNFITAPLIADLFLLAILAIGRQEVHDGTVGADNISPIDIMAFFITLAYIAISIDASGLIRYLAFKVLQWGGKVGHRLFFFLYVFFFGLGSFIGNDPIILSGTAFLAYMTRVSSNIVHPRAWIYTQFAVANIASAILVSSNPTNLVLAGAFGIKFIVYTANMIVPVVATVILLFPFLLYILFADEALIPASIKMHELPPEALQKPPVNPNIPHAKDEENDIEGEEDATDEQKREKLMLSLEEIMNPFLDKGGAAFGALIMAATLITILVLNASSAAGQAHPVFWVTTPAAFVMFVWDVAWGWIRRKETREIAQQHKQHAEAARTRRQSVAAGVFETNELEKTNSNNPLGISESAAERSSREPWPRLSAAEEDGRPSESGRSESLANMADLDHHEKRQPQTPLTPALVISTSEDFRDRDNEEEKGVSPTTADVRASNSPVSGEKQALAQAAPRNDPSSDAEDSKTQKRPVFMDVEAAHARKNPPASLQSLLEKLYLWAQYTFPTAVAVARHLPFALVPFALAMFVLVQALVSKGWVIVFAHGWDHWVNKTGTVGAVGGMGFLSVVLCNFAGTNIGTTILLSRIIQAWESIHKANGTHITNRNFWATVYSMALGVNYGAFSTAFSASLAGLLWRDILARKQIHVRRLDFARINFPIIAISMTIGCLVLIGQVYISRDTKPRNLSGA